MKKLPISEDIESSIISVILVSSEEGKEELERFKPEHFSVRSYRIIFETFKSMQANGQKVDLVTITNNLRDNGLLSEIGGIGEISKMSTLSPPVSISQCLEILSEKHKLRELIEMAEIISSCAYQNTESSVILKSIDKTTFSFHETGKTESLTESATGEVLSNLEMKERGEKISGLKTNIIPWDLMLGGLVKARFYVLAARAGRGKTAMIEQMITQMLIEQNPVLIFEKDMSAAMLISRMACRIAGVAFTKFDLGHCSQQEYNQIKSALGFLKKSNLHLYSPSNLSILDFRTIVKREKRKNGIKAVFLDHVLNLDVGKELREGLTYASSQIRESVQESELPHVILAQLNREADKCTRPAPAHIKEFDALYADCDVMAMLWSEETSSDLTPGQPMTVKFTVNKNRYGSEFEDEMSFDRALMKFNPNKK